MRRMALYALALTAFASGTAAANAQSQTAASPSGLSPSNNVTGPDHRNRMVCRSQGDSSSRLRRQRVCTTQAEWDEQQRIERQNVERAQTNRIWPG